MAAPIRLGKREVDALICPPDKHDLLVFDDDVTGFCVRVTRAGAKVFLMQYRAGKAVRRLRLGLYGDITPAQARSLALQVRLRLAAGGDPVIERQQQLEAQKRQAQEDALTFEALAEQWSNQGLEGNKERYRNEAARALRVNFALLARKPAARIEQPEAHQAIDQIAQDRGKAMARRSHSYARATYNWAVKRRLVRRNPFENVVIEGREQSRDRSLSDAELGEVWRAAGELGPPFDNYFRFLMLTLQRLTETAGIRWSEISPDGTEWHIPAERTKNGRPHLVHLSAPARAILASLPRHNRVDLVFTTTRETPISGFSHAKQRLDDKITAARQAAAGENGAAPLTPWRLHDLRRTGVTALSRQGVQWAVADRVLNHVQGAIKGVAAVYQRHDFLEERRQAMDIWGAHVLAAAAKPVSGRETPTSPSRRKQRNKTEP